MEENSVCYVKHYKLEYNLSGIKPFLFLAETQVKKKNIYITKLYYTN